MEQADQPILSRWRQKVQEIIFESDTPSGKLFDEGLIIAIILSVMVVMMESITTIRLGYGKLLLIAEWVFTILFTIEYILRLLSVGKPLKYATSFFGVIDLLAVIPTYLSVFFPGTQALLVIRLLRILRVFRVLKLVKYLTEAHQIMYALRASRRKLLVFIFAVITLVTILGSMMYFIEGEEHGFTSIPRGIYWAIVTLTTVGYGDISPQTNLGQVLASMVMIMGYAIIAVPTGIVTAELARGGVLGISGQSCPQCSAEGHDLDAVHCKYCGASL